MILHAKSGKSQLGPKEIQTTWDYAKCPVGSRPTGNQEQR